MNEYEYIGVDVSKTKFDVALKLGEHYKHKVFTSDPKGYNSFLQWLEKHAQNPWICMEATGHYSERLAEFLVTQNIRVSVANPCSVKNFLRAKLARNKNDQIDSYGIRDYCECMNPKLYRVKPKAQKELRDLNNLLNSLKGQLTRLNNQLESVQGEIAKKTFKKQIKQLEKDIKKLEEQIAEVISADAELNRAQELMCSISGIGKTTACVFLAIMPAIENFNNARQFAAYIGITPRQNQSGNMQGKTSISRLGNPDLRKALYMPSLVAKRSNKGLSNFVKKLEAKHKPPKVIICAVMRRLAHIIFGVLKNDMPYDEKVLKAS